MSRSASSGFIIAAAVILVVWGVIYCIAALYMEAAPGETGLDLIRLESISKGILITWAGLILFHLPALIRRGEYQAIRILSFSSFFLVLLALWHLHGFGRQGILIQATFVVLGLCFLLTLLALTQIRRRLHLPRL